MHFLPPTVHDNPDSFLPRMKALQPVPAKVDRLVRLEANLFAVDNLIKDPPLGGIVSDSPEHFVGQGMVVAKIDDGVIDEDAIGQAGTWMPIFVKLNNDFNEFNNSSVGGNAPAGDNFRWYSLVHGTPFHLTARRPMCSIDETV